MSEILIVLLYTAVIAIVEFIGVGISKVWVAVGIAYREADNRIADEMIKPGVFPRGQAQDRNIIISKYKEIRGKARQDILLECLKTMAPGPELCFLTATLAMSLFLIFHYSSELVKQALCPTLANSENAVPILVAFSVVSLVLWLATITWREIILSELQNKYRRLSSSLIFAIGCGCVAIMLYFFIAGR